MSGSGMDTFLQQPRAQLHPYRRPRMGMQQAVQKGASWQQAASQRALSLLHMLPGQVQVYLKPCRASGSAQKLQELLKGWRSCRTARQEWSWLQGAQKSLQMPWRPSLQRPWRPRQQIIFSLYLCKRVHQPTVS